MAQRPRRSFSRPLGERRYNKLIIIAAEGAKTELQYFEIFNSQDAEIYVKCLKRKTTDSSPYQVLKRMKEYIRKEGLIDIDEAWLVVDMDDYVDKLPDLLKWSRKKDNYGLAVSNPKFEYWLLLHFEDGNKITSSSKCNERLRKYLPDYDKGINEGKLRPGVKAAIRRARQRDRPPQDWPKGIGTTVYRLVEKLQSTIFDRTH